MAYTNKVIIDEWSDIMTKEEFIESSQYGMLHSDDGYGHPIKEINGELFEDPTINLDPGNMEEIPEDSTHINWFNK